MKALVLQLSQPLGRASQGNPAHTVPWESLGLRVDRVERFLRFYGVKRALQG